MGYLDNPRGSICTFQLHQSVIGNIDLVES
jgi:hypothetical protein